MPNSEFLKILATGRLLFLDGAMGTMLQAAGMPPGIGPDAFCLANPDILKNIHRAYLDAGANIITTCTFGANGYKLPPGADVFETNRRLALIASEAVAGAGVAGPVFVAGDVGPTGVFAKPLGQVEPGDMIRAFADQIRGLAAGGCDLIFMETQFDIAETRAAVAAARECCDLPVMVSMTFEQGVSLTGSTPEIFAETMQNMGADVIGSNCSLGPDEMLPVAREFLSVCEVPVMAEPNAGLPILRDGQTIFPLGPEEYAQKTAVFAEIGVQILGGCCGTTPAHIKKLKEAVMARVIPPREKPKSRGICLTSRSRLCRIGFENPLAIIGERINPTGKSALAAQLQKGEFSEALKLADEQAEAGAAVLDVNVGAPLVDETVLLPELVQLLTSRQLAPLSLDSSNEKAISRALPYYPASCLVNSISGEAGKMEKLGPLCRKFGAPFILLPLAGSKLPVKAGERIAIVEKLLDQARKLGIPDRLIMIDALALAISSNPDGATQCLEMIRWCAREGFATTVGLSNISFGLPARGLLNSVFLCMAHGAGLSSCIANPMPGRIREACDAMQALLGQDRDAQKFIDAYASWQSAGGGRSDTAPANKNGADSLHDCVLKGDRENVLAWLDKELAAGRDPFALVNDVLIPAITEVGARYEKREYFLPQLIRSAETMQLAFGRLKPLLEAARGSEKRPVIVMATVEGDIHDIGKNIVSLLLGNHGFDVIDAGKDVPASEIVACAEKNGACIIGLSALMTTTMVRMEDTVRLVRERNLPMRIMVGGAAVTPAFARSIGADAYCADAVSGVRAAKEFIAETNLSANH